MKIIRDLCKVLDCYGIKILYNGFDNTITEFDNRLQESLNDRNGIYFNEYFAEVFCEYDIEDIKLKSSNRLSHAIINLTEDCNMRCKYCGYHDLRYVNSNSLKDIDKITLKSTLDFIIAHSVDSYETTISFYGGEPLLRFDLIKFAVEYLEVKNNRGHKYTYRLTTNGTLLDLNFIDYFVNKNIMCVISLDGPIFIHDRYRVYKGDNPTYADIMKNLKKIAKKYPVYYEKNISFNAVISPPYSRSIPKDYFDKSEVRFLNVSIGNYFSKFLKKKHCLELNGFEFKEKSEMIHLQMSKMNRDELMKNINYIGSLKKYMHIGKINHPKFIFPSGFCVPLVRRIYIRTNGEIALCERVDESNLLFHMGDVITGYDFNKINILYKHTNNILAENCSKCWAFRFCRACFTCLDKIEYNGNFCKFIRNEIENELIDFLEFKYNNKRFNEIMQSVSIE
ncbi:MAG: radical SAM protein [Fibromonadales bacterium]|nr:radical SAM protein [Fibromonadales bacterium]